VSYPMPPGDSTDRIINGEALGVRKLACALPCGSLLPQDPWVAQLPELTETRRHWRLTLGATLLWNRRILSAPRSRGRCIRMETHGIFRNN